MKPFKHKPLTYFWRKKYLPNVRVIAYLLLLFQFPSRLLHRIAYKYTRPKMHSEKSDIIQVNSSNSYIYENIPICTNERKESPPSGLVIYKVIIVL